MRHRISQRLQTVAPLPQQTETDRKDFFKEKNIMCNESHIRCQVSGVACNLSLTAKATARDPPVATSPTMYSRLVCKDLKTSEKIQNKKNHQNGKNTKQN